MKLGFIMYENKLGINIHCLRENIKKYMFICFQVRFLQKQNGISICKTRGPPKQADPSILSPDSLFGNY